MQNIQSFAMCLEEIAKEVPVPSKQVWNSMAHVATHLLVEGTFLFSISQKDLILHSYCLLCYRFSNVKKCSAGGRALMQLDFANFMSFLELISNQKYPQHRSYVDVFIKTYYFAPEQFEQWIEQQRTGDEYSLKQLNNLIHCICVSDKRTRQRLLQLLDAGIQNGIAMSTTPTTTPQKNNHGSVAGSNLSSVI